MASKMSQDDVTYVQAQVVNDFNARMASACFDMCVKDMEVSKLDVEEHICVDRCALKYFVVHQEVQGVMTRVREMNELRQQMMESQNAAYNAASTPSN